MNLNKAFVLGNLTRDPESRTMPSGQPVVSFGLATNRFYTDSVGEKKQDVEFHNIVCFGKLADIASRYLKKGSLALIEGRLKTRNWEGSAGVKQYKTEIIAESLQLGPKGIGQQSSQSSYDAQQSRNTTFADNQNQAQNKPEDIPIIEENYTPPANNEKNDDEIDVKEIPF